MGTPYLCELKLVSFSFAPKGWAQCNGQTLPINQNQAIFALLGTTYGGNGQTTFLLPNLQGRIPMHIGNGHVQGEAGGETAHTVIQSEMPVHTHALQGSGVAQNSTNPAAHMFANTSGTLTVYGPASAPTAMSPGAITNAGGSQPHENESPYLVMNWVIALQGIFPSRN